MSVSLEMRVRLASSYESCRASLPRPALSSRRGHQDLGICRLLASAHHPATTLRQYGSNQSLHLDLRLLLVGLMLCRVIDHACTRRMWSLLPAVPGKVPKLHARGTNRTSTRCPRPHLELQMSPQQTAGRTIHFHAIRGEQVQRLQTFTQGLPAT